VFVGWSTFCRHVITCGRRFPTDSVSSTQLESSRLCTNWITSGQHETNLSRLTVFALSCIIPAVPVPQHCVIISLAQSSHTRRSDTSMSMIAAASFLECTRDVMRRGLTWRGWRPGRRTETTVTCVQSGRAIPRRRNPDSDGRAGERK